MSDLDVDKILNEAGKGKRGKRSKRPSYDNPLDQVSAKKTAKAVNDTTMAGEDKRKTIYLPPAAIEEIDAAANEAGMNIKDMYRWLIEVGWEAWLDGERPVVETVRTKAQVAQREWGRAKR